MASGNTWCKKLMTKAKMRAVRDARGGFKQHNEKSVEVNDDVPHRRVARGTRTIMVIGHETLHLKARKATATSPLLPKDGRSFIAYEPKNLRYR